MVTFTLPFQFRQLARRLPKQIYSLFFLCVSGVLKDFGLNPKHLGAEIGMTMVLHTNSRSLNYHPYIHVIVPGSDINRSRKQWKKKKDLFKKQNLAKVFRARFLTALKANGFSIPKNVPLKWIVDCECVGKGIPAIKYLSRYLYRGVISEKNIIADRNGQVTFQYVESKTKKNTFQNRKRRRLYLAHFAARSPQRLSQKRPAFKCPCCKSPITVIGFRLNPG